MKTIKQIADMLGVSKQRVYRYIKSNHINEAHQERGVMYYDESAQSTISMALSGVSHQDEVHQKHINDTVNEAAFEALKEQLHIKDMQIAALTAALENTTSSLNAAQALHAADKQQLLLMENKKNEKSGLFGIFRKKYKDDLY